MKFSQILCSAVALASARSIVAKAKKPEVRTRSVSAGDYRGLQSQECLTAYNDLRENYPQFTAAINDVFQAWASDPDFNDVDS